jgi:hypothetical protein
MNDNELKAVNESLVMMSKFDVILESSLYSDKDYKIYNDKKKQKGLEYAGWGKFQDRKGDHFKWDDKRKDFIEIEKVENKEHIYQKTGKNTGTYIRKLPEQIEKFLSKFPDDAKDWSKATEEIRDLARAVRERAGLEEVKALDFRLIKTPAEWNKKGKDYIRKIYNTLSEPDKKAFYNDYKEWFESKEIKNDPKIGTKIKYAKDEEKDDKEKEDKKNYEYMMGMIKDLLPRDEYGIDIQLSSSKGKTKWTKLNKSVLKALETLIN